jgi:hypothetical protein
MKKTLTLAAIVLLLAACSKEPTCYDPALKAEGRICPMDCPSVCGCDGKDYCNDCIAKQNGIPSSTPGRCK